MIENPDLNHATSTAKRRQGKKPKTLPLSLGNNTCLTNTYVPNQHNNPMIWIVHPYKPYPHQIKHDYPLNLSILISGGKETNWDVLSNGEWSGQSSNLKSARAYDPCRIVVFGLRNVEGPSANVLSVLEHAAIEGESPVRITFGFVSIDLSASRVVWECSPNTGGWSHPKLNIATRPIANKYCEGKVKRTLRRGSKELEIVRREPYQTCD